MPELTNILVATDMSPRSDRAVRRAFALARVHELPVTVLMVLDDAMPPDLTDMLHAKAEMELERFLATVGEGVAHDTIIRVGDPTKDILHYAANDPKTRVKWMGPDMSVRSSVTARIMETWAHGQAIYDLLGKVRRDRDSIKNVAVIGINTFGWTYINRKLPVPDQIPSVHLTAPSGASWDWPNENSQDKISGSATEFCQVVTQTRNIADTSLNVVGDVANEWMATAQCFAGPVEEPPAPGLRRTS